jgi:predicted nucleic acid-binding protein
MIIVLDSGPAGLIIFAKANPRSEECLEWIETVVNAGHIVAFPEIIDYELRRELMRMENQTSLDKLDSLSSSLLYMPITTQVMRRAAEFWATARQQGQQTSGDKTIDIDMNLAAQAVLLSESQATPTVIATTNVRHLSLFAKASEWRAIS